MCTTVQGSGLSCCVWLAGSLFPIPINSAPLFYSPMVLVGFFLFFFFLLFYPFFCFDIYCHGYPTCIASGFRFWFSIRTKEWFGGRQASVIVDRLFVVGGDGGLGSFSTDKIFEK
ncbi:hypothetical protein BD289DRAFT_431584 [Coniella lustricola]|uniref:Uncharacterized protein n=1 Tax=Coniella lustricola TaxID=2025994 RepID=A0A2T3AAI7_9PEZI|nr:hypothetical protein BD289DRAFT_431584 [Coniella lustricola]